MLNNRINARTVSCAAMLFVCTYVHSALAQSPPPNIVMIVVDDMRFDEFGAGGHQYLETPNIDALAHEGAMFTNAYHVTPLCSPNRASLVTGQYPSRHGVSDNTSRSFASHRLENFATYLRNAGYQTAHVGKWHMGNDPTPRPGYDYWVSFAGQGRIINPEIYEDDRLHQVKGYVTDVLTDRAVDFIEQSDDQPFMLYLAHKAVHPDLTQLDDGTVDISGGSAFIPAERHANRYDGQAINRMPEALFSAADPAAKPVLAQALEIRESAAMQEVFGPIIGGGTTDEVIRQRAQMMLAIDESTGRIIDALETAGKAEDTVVIFTSDNGYFFGEHGLHIERRLPYEAALRSPLLIRYPGFQSQQTLLDAIVLSIDYAPTILELAGVQVPDSMQGNSIVPLLNGSAEEVREVAYMEFYSHENPMPWTADLDYRVVRTGNHKYIYWLRFPDQPELYDLSTDPHELNNLINEPEFAELIERMHALTREHAAAALGF